MELKTATIGVTKDRKSIWYRPELMEEDVVADYTNLNEQLSLPEGTSRGQTGL